MEKLLYLAVLAMATSLVSVPAALAQSETGDLYCIDFSDTAEDAQNQAQALLKRNPDDPNGLDADGDGVACEYTSSAQGSVAFEDQSGYTSGASAAPQEQQQTPPGAEVAPVTPPAADGPVVQPAEPDAAVLPDTGGPGGAALLLPTAGLLLATGLVGLKVARRRS